MSATFFSIATAGGILLVGLFWLWLMVKIWERVDD